jgi:hypothetical protein
VEKFILKPNRELIDGNNKEIGQKGAALMNTSLRIE